MRTAEYQKSSYLSSDIIPQIASKQSSDNKNHFTDQERASSSHGIRDFSSVSILPKGSGSVQAKLKINAPNDKYEQEADRVADRVVNMADRGIQRKCSSCEEEKIQTKTNGNSGVQASASLTNKISNSKSGGRGLDSATRSFMENSIGADFSDVRIHSGNEASAMNQEINARAFTVGRNIFFNQGEYAPNSIEGKRLLAHELTHTIQQGSSRGVGIQKADDDKKKKAPVTKTKVEVVTETDISSGKTKGSTTVSGEQEVTKGVTVKASDKTTDENREVTSEVKGKKKSADKKKEAFAAGGVKLTFPRDPSVADSWSAYIKVGGKIKLFDKRLTLDGSAKGEVGPKTTPKLSLDGNVVYIPNKRFSAGVLTNMVIKAEGVSGKITPELTFNILENLSIKAGVPISVDKKGKVEVKGMAGLTLTF